MSVTVLVPTYRRPEDLARCLEALRKQTHPPDEVLVVVRDTDSETRALLEGIEHGPLSLRTVQVTEPGVVAAMNAGLEVAQGEIIALTDDDAAPRSDWLANIEAHFQADPKVGGVGGRDWIHHGDRVEDGARRVVGQVQWFGRVIGNHHLGVGGPREVDQLKGVNCAYRSAAIRHVGFDERLLGTGAQVRWELSLGLQLRHTGWKLVYDPAVAVDHYEGGRHDEARIGYFDVDTKAVFNAAYNEVVALYAHLSFARKIAYIFWSFFIGTRSYPGLLQAIRFTPTQKMLAWRRFVATQRGKARRLLRKPSKDGVRRRVVKG